MRRKIFESKDFSASIWIIAKTRRLALVGEFICVDREKKDMDRGSGRSGIVSIVVDW